MEELRIDREMSLMYSTPIFGLAGLSLMGFEGLEKINEVYCLPVETVKRLGLR